MRGAISGQIQDGRNAAKGGYLPKVLEWPRAAANPEPGATAVMIYTIGHKENYMKAIAQQIEPVLKVGKTTVAEQRLRWEEWLWMDEDYPGGYAFLTAEDAQRRIDEAYPEHDFAVFGLQADWEADTEPSQDGWWHNLLRDAALVVLEQRPL